MNFFKLSLFALFAVFIVSCGSRNAESVRSEKVVKSETRNRHDEVSYIPYYAAVYKADSLMLTENYAESFRILDALLKKYRPVNAWMVNVPRNYLVTKSKVSKVEKKDIENYLDHAYHVNGVMRDQFIVKFLDEFKIDKTQVEKTVAKNVAKIDIGLRNELGKMTLRDQEVRRTMNYDSIQKVDWQHSERLKEIIETKGFPNNQMIGGYTLEGQPNSEVFLSQIFNHMAYNGDFEYFKKKLPECIRNGSCDPYNYAMMIDRRNEITKQPIDYHVIIPVAATDDRKRIDANRKAIGMPSLAYEEFKKKLMGD